MEKKVKAGEINDNEEAILRKANKYLEKKKRSSVFEFILGDLTIINSNYKKDLEKAYCLNRKIQLLLQGANNMKNIKPNAPLRRQNSVGTYLFDELDFVTYYCKNQTFESVPMVGQTFPIVGALVYYDKTKFKKIDNDSYLQLFQSLPKEKDIQNYINKKVETNGIHCIEAEGEELTSTTKSKDSMTTFEYEGPPAPLTSPFPKEGFFAKKYVTKKSQILPLFSFTMKRVEYCIIWRDSNFLKDKELFEGSKESVEELKNLNIYFEKTTEDALKLVWKKKYNKIILITNVGSNLEGKTYTDKVREILGFNVVVLFFVSSTRHLDWIKNYPNSLFADNDEIVDKFVNIFNKEEGNKEEDLNNLKKEIETVLKTKLQDFNEPMKYPLFKDGKSAYNSFSLFNVP